MDRIAWIGGETVIYYSSVILTLAAVTAICFFLSYYLGTKDSRPLAGFVAIPLCIAFGLFFGRFFHWYSRANSYDGFFAAITDYTSGNYALPGVFLGCFLAAVLTRLLGLHKSLPGMLDAMSLAAPAGICLGRLASFYNASARGQVIQYLKFLPFSYPVTNAVSGATEYRFATFLFQSLMALFLFLVLGHLYRKARRDREYIPGDATFVFLLCYGASQVVLDSTRYDSLFFRSNGFVSVVQVLGAVAIVIALVIFSVRYIRNHGFRLWLIPLWVLILGCMGGAGFMEYYVQRRGNEAVFAYSIMSLCLVAAVLLILMLRSFAVPSTRTVKK